jgi:hypothetical protein
VPFIAALQRPQAVVGDLQAGLLPRISRHNLKFRLMLEPMLDLKLPPRPF